MLASREIDAHFGNFRTESTGLGVSVDVSRQRRKIS
jgi:hypothetical protein